MNNVQYGLYGMRRTHCVGDELFHKLAVRAAELAIGSHCSDSIRNDRGRFQSPHANVYIYI